MLFQGTYSLTIIDIIIILCWISVITLVTISSAIFFYKAKDKAKKFKIYLLAIALFFLLYAINRTLFFLHELLYDPPMWSISLNEYNTIMATDSFKAARYDLLWRISTAIGSYGLLIFLIALESQILEKKTHFIFSIIQAILTTISLILGTSGDQLTIGRWILYLGILPALSVPFLYFYLGGKAKGDARKSAIEAGLGFLIYYLGVAANSSAGKSLFSWLFGFPGLHVSYLIYGVFVTFGLIIYIKSIRV